MLGAPSDHNAWQNYKYLLVGYFSHQHIVLRQSLLKRVKLAIVFGNVVQAPKAENLARVKELLVMMISSEKRMPPLGATSLALTANQVAPATTER